VVDGEKRAAEEDSEETKLYRKRIGAPKKESNEIERNAVPFSRNRLLICLGVLGPMTWGHHVI
jgi:hypothetical protein